MLCNMSTAVYKILLKTFEWIIKIIFWYAKYAYIKLIELIKSKILKAVNLFQQVNYTLWTCF